MNLNECGSYLLRNNSYTSVVPACKPRKDARPLSFAMSPSHAYCLTQKEDKGETRLNMGHFGTAKLSRVNIEDKLKLGEGYDDDGGVE